MQQGFIVNGKDFQSSPARSSHDDNSLQTVYVENLMSFTIIVVSD